MNTPVDFQREVGADNTHAQAKLLGTLGCIYGSFILVLVLIPNPLSGAWASSPARQCCWARAWDCSCMLGICPAGALRREKQYRRAPRSD